MKATAERIITLGGSGRPGSSAAAFLFNPTPKTDMSNCMSQLKSLQFSGRKFTSQWNGAQTQSNKRLMDGGKTGRAGYNQLLVILCLTFIQVVRHQRLAENRKNWENSKKGGGYMRFDVGLFARLQQVLQEAEAAFRLEYNYGFETAAESHPMLLLILLPFMPIAAEPKSRHLVTELVLSAVVIVAYREDIAKDTYMFYFVAGCQKPMGPLRPFIGNTLSPEKCKDRGRLCQTCTCVPSCKFTTYHSSLNYAIPDTEVCVSQFYAVAMLAAASHQRSPAYSIIYSSNTTPYLTHDPRPATRDSGSETEKISCTLLLCTLPGALARSVYGPVRSFLRSGSVVGFGSVRYLWRYLWTDGRTSGLGWTDGRMGLDGMGGPWSYPTFAFQFISLCPTLLSICCIWASISGVSLRGKDFDGMLGIWMWTNAFVCRVG
ncbi:hypothetical protein DFP72DRAFT_851956 [Ephemerocybe angulata]|uniref:Uncharacterized protein n=1 Tax=Ephemerocybe angulata TaxID=980116 RepID=A0A8H6HNI0_9AGAR|nr:hypothetical protein DFP72DRAFT_851956 [Tulosesus angulatus]